MGRHQGMDRSGVCQVSEGSGEQGKMEESVCEIICGAPTTLTIKGYTMMMIHTVLKMEWLTTIIYTNYFY